MVCIFAYRATGVIMCYSWNLATQFANILSCFLDGDDAPNPGSAEQRSQKNTYIKLAFDFTSCRFSFGYQVNRLYY